MIVIGTLIGIRIGVDMGGRAANAVQLQSRAARTKGVDEIKGDRRVRIGGEVVQALVEQRDDARRVLWTRKKARWRGGGGKGREWKSRDRKD